MDLVKEIPSLLSLIASIVFNDSIRGEKLHLSALSMKYERWREYWQENREY